MTEKPKPMPPQTDEAKVDEATLGDCPNVSSSERVMVDPRDLTTNSAGPPIPEPLKKKVERNGATRNNAKPKQQQE